MGVVDKPSAAVGKEAASAVRNSVGEFLLVSGFQVRREAPLPPVPLSDQHKVDVSELLRPADLLLGFFG